VDECDKNFKEDDYGRLWPTVRSYTQQTYSYHLGKIMVADSEFVPMMNQYHSLLWYRSGFKTFIKCYHINNNLTESFNNKVKLLKDLRVHVTKLVASFFFNAKLVAS
jgi:hypothetical protein